MPGVSWLISCEMYMEIYIAWDVFITDVADSMSFHHLASVNQLPMLLMRAQDELLYF